MEHFLSSSAVLAATALTLGVWATRLPSRERGLVWAAFFAHVVSTLAMLWIIIDVYDGIGDALTYLRQGTMLAAYVRIDPADHFMEVLQLILHGDPGFPFRIIGVGHSTGTMAGIAGIWMLLTDSLWASSMAMAMISFTGQLALYAGLRQLFAPEFRTRLALACLLLPSVVFWTSGMQKESLMFFGLGWTVYGLCELRRRGLGLHLLLFPVSLTAIGLVKPYVLFPLSVGLGTWLYWRRAVQQGRGTVRIRPIALVAAGAVSFLLLVLLGNIFPAYSLENVGETAASQQYYGRAVGGGSFVETGNPEARSLVGQFAYAPLALISSLFRPFLFEVSNAMMLINALETTLLLGLLVHALWVFGPRATLRRIWSSPTLMATTVFVLLLGTGVGLGTTNLGTLSRYRIPMMPFFALLLVSLSFRGRRRSPRTGD